MSQWIDVKERLPELNEHVLIFADGMARIDYRIPVNNGIGWKWGHDYSDGHPLSFTSHWQPVPSPPPRRWTKDEALEAAIGTLEGIVGVDHAGVYVRQATIDVLDRLLPKLREALA